MAFLDSSVGGASRSIDFEDVAEARESAASAAKSLVAQTGAEILEAMAREANGAVLWFCELATLAAVALALALVFEVSVWKQFVAATSATLFLTVAACLGAYVLMLRSDGDSLPFVICSSLPLIGKGEGVRGGGPERIPRQRGGSGPSREFRDGNFPPGAGIVPDSPVTMVSQPGCSEPWP